MNWKPQPELEKFEEDERELRQMLARLPSCSRQAADLPEAFWRRQQIGIRAAIVTRPAPISWSALAFGAAVVALIVVMLFKDTATDHHSPPPLQVENISDQQLLMKVEYTLQNDVPVALEPAALLAKEMEAKANYNYSEGDQE
jgi:hypothetical protein